MAFENGVDWQPLEPEKRGRHETFASAVSAAQGDLASLLAVSGGFGDAVADAWPKLFPRCAARPGRYEGGVLYLYIRSASARYGVQMTLPQIRRRLAALPGAPAKLDLRLEVHAT